MTNKIEINKRVPQDRWVEFFDMFSNSNRGRQIAIEVLDSEVGDEPLIRDAQLMSIVYDPAHKGNDLVIETGQHQVSYAHTIAAPAEIWTGQDENGVVLAVAVKDSQGAQTLVSLN